MTAELRVLYFEDDANDRNTYARRLSDGGFRVDAVSPPHDLALGIVQEQPWDLFLLDYELTGAQANGEHANYKGGTLAFALREHVTDHPVVLFTRPGLVSPSDQRRLLAALGVFDELLYKGDVDSDPDTARARLRALADGFAQLRASEKTWAAAIALMGANEDEGASLQEAAPPISDGAWSVGDLASWLRHVLIEFPGILYGPLYASTALGISKTAFDLRGVEDRFAPAKYVGAFSQVAERWWRDRLLKVALSTIADAGLDGPIYQSFGPAFEKVAGVALEPAVCNDCGETPADAVCFVLNQPVKTAHSLAYYPDPRPGAMNVARMSFRAIRESNDVDEELIDPNARHLVAQIRAG
ncbi:MAG: response regulator [Chloroflexi bacterium]|nr:response regulator [Chloroflexota bacterium]